VKELWILRHAHAEPYHDEATDFARRLDRRGVSEAEAIGRLAAILELRFDLVLASPAARTLATAEAVCRALDDAAPRPQLREEPAIYLADRRTLVAILRALPDGCERTLIVGHNPGVSRLVHWATDDDRLGELRPATLVGTRAEVGLWSEADQGAFERLRVLRPEDAAL